jgi:hypothetical protein
VIRSAVVRAIGAVVVRCSVLAAADTGFGVELVRGVARRHEDQKVIETWHRVVACELRQALNGLLADDVVLYPPIVTESD